MLSVVITGCGSGSQAEAESESEAPANISLDELLDMSTAAGLDCASFTEWSDADVMGGGVTEMGTCNPGTRNVSSLMIFDDHDAAVGEADRVREDDPEVVYGMTVPETFAGPQVLGSNWIVSSEQAEDLSARLEGEFLPPDEGWAEQDQCEDQVMEIVGSMFTDQMGETSGAWQRAVYNYGTEDPAYVMSVPILQNALPQISANGLQSALAVAIGEAAVKCSEYIAAPASAAVPESNDRSRGTELPSSDLSASSADWPPSEPLPDFEGDACPVAPEISGGAIECAAAQAVVDECEGAVAPLEVVRYGGGTIEWARVSSAYAGNAVTSAELDLGPEVLSCGDNDNGIDIDAFMKDLKREAEAGWGFAVTSIACSLDSDRLTLVEMPVGQAVASCVVWGDSANGWAYVSVTENEPFYELGLGE